MIARLGLHYDRSLASSVAFAEFWNVMCSLLGATPRVCFGEGWTLGDVAGVRAELERGLSDRRSTDFEFVLDGRAVRGDVFVARDETLAIEGRISWANLLSIQLRGAWLAKAESLFDELCSLTWPAFATLSDVEEWQAHAVVDTGETVVGAPANHPVEPPYVLARTYLAPRYRPARIVNLRGVNSRSLGEGRVVELGALKAWRTDEYAAAQRTAFEALRGPVGSDHRAAVRADGKCPMMIRPDETLIAICRLIVSEQRSEAEWAEVESDDAFQEGPYVGGFDATENEFCFETIVDEREYWFQFSLQQAQRIAAGEKVELHARLAE